MGTFQVDLRELAFAARALVVVLGVKLAIYLAAYVFTWYPSQFDFGLSLLGAFAALKAQRSQGRSWVYAVASLLVVLLPVFTSVAIALLAADAAATLREAGCKVNRLLWPEQLPPRASAA